MRKTIFAAILMYAAGFVFAGNALAQQGTSAQQAPASSQKSSAAKTPAKASTAPATVLTTDKQKESYALGMNVGRNLKGLLSDPTIIDMPALSRGIKDTLTGSKPLLSDQDVTAVLQKLQAAAQEARKELADKNLKDSQAFLAANKNKDGVTTLPDGLQYKILKEGSGPKPTATDSVACQYRGTLVDGTEFDSSAKRGPMPAVFLVNHVIKGWTEALEMMPVGSKWELYIPTDLAYGEKGYPGTPIGPNAALIFDIELLSIQPSAPPAGQRPPQAPGQTPGQTPPGTNTNTNPNPNQSK